MEKEQQQEEQEEVEEVLWGALVLSRRDNEQKTAAGGLREVGCGNNGEGARHMSACTHVLLHRNAYQLFMSINLLYFIACARTWSCVQLARTVVTGRPFSHLRY